MSIRKYGIRCNFVTGMLDAYLGGLIIKLRVRCIQFCIVLDLDFGFHPRRIDKQCAVPVDQVPLLFVVRCGFRCNNGVLPDCLVFATNGLCIGEPWPVGVVRELGVQRTACKLGPVQTRWLLRGMVTETDREELGAIGCAEVERIGCVGCAEFVVLQLQYLHDRLVHSRKHLVQWVFNLPRFLRPGASEIRHVECCRVLRVGRTEDVAVSIEGEKIGKIAANRREIRYHTVVHEDMAAKHERVRVDG